MNVVPCAQPLTLTPFRKVALFYSLYQSSEEESSDGEDEEGTDGEGTATDDDEDSCQDSEEEYSVDHLLD